MPRLSVVVPVYNVEKYLNQCIDSILGQSFSDFELILVDDGSKDRSGSICDAYAQLDPRVSVIHTENKGAISARKTGINQAHGRYISFVDSDDWLDLDYYRCIFEAAGETGADIFLCMHANCGIGRTTTTTFSAGYYDVTALKRDVLPRMMYDFCMERYHITPSLSMDKVFRAELLMDAYAGVDERITLGDDAVCSYTCLAHVNSLLVLENSACYNYREDHISMINDCDAGLLERVFVLANNMNQQFANLPEIFDKQVQDYIAYVGLYAVRQVLVANREVQLGKRLQMVKEFLKQPVMAHAFRKASSNKCSIRVRCKLWLVLLVSRIFGYH